MSYLSRSSDGKQERNVTISQDQIQEFSRRSDCPDPQQGQLIQPVPFSNFGDLKQSGYSYTIPGELEIHMVSCNGTPKPLGADFIRNMCGRVDPGLGGNCQGLNGATGCYAGTPHDNDNPSVECTTLGSGSAPTTTAVNMPPPTQVTTQQQGGTTLTPPGATITPQPTTFATLPSSTSGQPSLSVINIVNTPFFGTPQTTTGLAYPPIRTSTVGGDGKTTPVSATAIFLKCDPTLPTMQMQSALATGAVGVNALTSSACSPNYPSGSATVKYDQINRGSSHGANPWLLGITAGVMVANAMDGLTDGAISRGAGNALKKTGRILGFSR